MATRDKARYEYKELDERQLDTLVGQTSDISTIEYETQDWVYLLDEKLKLPRYERVSLGLAELATV